MKTCTKCGETKPTEEFPTKGKGKVHAQCKTCRNAYMRKYYADNAETHKARVRNSPSRATTSKRNMAKFYGFESLSAYDEFIASQPELCPICQKRPAIYTDHCHTTGKVRGRLCPKCNFLLGQADDDPETLRRAIAYLGT